MLVEFQLRSFAKFTLKRLLFEENKVRYTRSPKLLTQVGQSRRCPRRPRAPNVRRGERGEPVKRRAAATGRSDRAPIPSSNSQLLLELFPLSSSLPTYMRPVWQQKFLPRRRPPRPGVPLTPDRSR